MASQAPYGAWASPISADHVARAGVTLDEVRVDGDAVLWIEGRPEEGGRQVVCRAGPGASPEEVTPAGFNVRTRVHEYGGGAYLARQGTVFFSNFADQRLWRQDPGEAPRPITPEPAERAADRYADAILTPDAATLICVRERHQGGEVANELVALPADGSGPPSVLAAGRDFYASPRLTVDGHRLAWLEWDHPRMPWDGTELAVADLAVSGAALAGRPELVAGGPEESIFQAEWSPGGALHFVSDRSGWWNLYRLQDGEPVPLAPIAEELGVPQWVFGLATYAFLPGGRIACLHGRGPHRRLGLLGPDGGPLVDLDLPFATFRPQLRAFGDRLAGLAGGPDRPTALVVIDPAGGELETVKAEEDDPPDPGYLSAPRPVEFPTAGDRTAHALYYPPANRDFDGPPGERPPLIVVSHGGPTSQASALLQLGYQFFTSRGFAVVDVDYGGSSGYGRAYRERLRGRWGVVDLADCVAAARWLADQGEVDAARLAIRGGSAGGYTTLCALVFSDAFAAGASYYGVADAEALARDTHKFESRYLDGLIGPWPEAAETYRARSPIHFTDRLSCPVILLQGLEDEVVPPAQAEAMVAALRDKGIPYAYLPFPGEQHGFRQAAHIRRALEAELSFYGRVLGFEPAGEIEPVAIENL
jgi:dipeptidyl aminopeptidase/acylaminoacyl peptidase